MPVPVRARVLGFAFLLAVITYLDRVCISAAAPYIMDDLHLSVLQMSVVFSAFTLVVLALRNPVGMARGREGPAECADAHRALVVRVHDADGRRARICVAGGDSVPVRRGGSGRASRTSREASRGGSRSASAAAPTASCFSARGWAAMLSAPIALLIVARWGWRASFVIFGLLGVVWAAAWYALVPRSAGGASGGQPRRARVDPAGWNAGDGHTSDAGHAMARAPPQPQPLRDLRDVLRVRLRAVLLLHLAADVSHHGARLLAPRRRPLRGAAVSARGNRRPRRRLADRPPVASVTAFASAAAIWVLPRSSPARLLVFASTLPIPGASRRRCCSRWRSRPPTSRSARAGRCRSTSRPTTPGSSPACMNTLGNLGGLVGPLVVGIAVDRWHSWTFPFYITALVYAGGALAWLAIDPTRRIRELVNS